MHVASYSLFVFSVLLVLVLFSIIIIIDLFIYYYWAGSSADVSRKKNYKDLQVLASYNDLIRVYSNVSKLLLNKFKSSLMQWVSFIYLFILLLFFST